MGTAGQECQVPSAGSRYEHIREGLRLNSVATPHGLLPCSILIRIRRSSDSRIVVGTVFPIPINYGNISVITNVFPFH